MGFFLVFVSSFLDQCGAKRALADKKGVFVRTIIAIISPPSSIFMCVLCAYHGKENCTKEGKSTEEKNKKKSELTLIYLL